MMAKVLIYGYWRGIRSSRKMERALHEDVGFRYLSADQQPDFWTIAAFRCRLQVRTPPRLISKNLTLLIFDIDLEKWFRYPSRISNISTYFLGYNYYTYSITGLLFLLKNKIVSAKQITVDLATQEG